jgi:DNA-binding LytR/AlgR family response regulator
MHTPLQQINCLIVDDEPLAQDVLISHIQRIGNLNITQCCNNAMEAFEALHKYKIDIIYLDINMPVVNGLSFLKSLKDPPAVILTTAYTEYALEGYELNVVDYLVKPISFERFQKAVQKAISNTGNINSAMDVAPTATESVVYTPSPNSNLETKKFFFVKSNGKLVKINYTDIKYIEGMKDYLKIHTTTGTIVTHSTMKAMEEQLPTSKFLRVHKSFILALSAIKAIDGSIIHLDIEKAEIPLGNSYKDALLQVINNI